MKYQIHDIDGVKTILMNLPDANSTTVQVFVNAGSVYESEDNNGISHFLEHMFFKWWRKYHNSREVAMVVDSFGGEFNAYTGKDIASYYVKSAPDYIYQSMDVLSDMLIYAAFPEEELETEKWVVIQEMKMNNDNPQRLMSLNASRRFYGNNGYGRSIIWSEKTVLDITRQNLLDWKNNLYNKNNLTLVIVGRLPDEAELKAKVSEYFANIPDGVRYEKPAFDINSITKEKSSFYDKWTEQNHLLMRCNGPIWDADDVVKQKEFAAATLAMVVFGGNMSSRLFQEIREKKGLCYYIHAGVSDSLVKWDIWIGNIYISAWLDKSQRDMAISDIQDQIDLLGQKGISESEFVMAKWYKLGWLQMGIETTDQRAEFLWPEYLQEGKILDLNYVYRLYDSLTLEDVNNSIKWFTKDNFYLYYIK